MRRWRLVDIAPTRSTTGLFRDWCLCIDITVQLSPFQLLSHPGEKMALLVVFPNP